MNQPNAQIDPRIQKRAKRVELAKLYALHMYYECAERGYDFRRGREASENYYNAAVEYQEKYGERFNPMEPV